MKAVLLVVLLLSTLLQAQDVNFKWAKRVGGTQAPPGSSAGGHAVTVDEAGNVYTTGVFSGTVDMDPGPGSFIVTGNGGMYIQKLDSSGNFVWAKIIWGPGPVAITLDTFGNIYTTGNFAGSVDFDPGPSIFSLSGSYGMVFICKLDTAGNFVWAKKMGKAHPNENGPAQSVKTDASGNVYISGNFTDSADFDPGPGDFILYGGYLNVFICKLDSAGNFIWVKAPQGFPTPANYPDEPHLFIDATGNILCAGSFRGPLDFDPGPGVYILDSDNSMGWTGYVWKLTADGDFSWAKRIGTYPSNPSLNDARDVSVDHDGNVYLTGHFTGTVDFDPGSGVYNLTSPIIHGSTYLCKLDSAGNFVWAKQLPDSNFSLALLGLSSINLDTFANVYATGIFSGTADFDPGSGVYNLTATGFYDIVIIKLDSDGNFRWAVQTQGIDTTSFAAGSSYVDAPGNIYTTGRFRGSVDFDPGGNVYDLTAVGEENMFVDKLGPCANSASILIQPLSQQSCVDTSVEFNVTASGAIAYQWQVSTDSGVTYIDIVGANASTYTITPVTALQNNNLYRCVVTGGCNTNISSSALLNTISTIITVQPQSISLCAGNDHTFSVTAAGASAYQWQLSIDGVVSFDDIAGATNSSYSLTSVTTQQNGYQYRCIVSTACGSLTSSVAELWVIDPVTIASQPFNTEICAGGNTSFSVSGMSTQVISYQWEVSTDGGTNFSPLLNGGIYSGTTTSVLTITSADLTFDNNRYRCKLSNAACSNAAVSKSVILNVRRLPSIELAANPFTSLFPWQTTTLTATSAGTGGDLSFNWYYNNVVVPNTGNSRMVNFDQIGNYEVQVYERWPSDLFCTNRSAIVTITAIDTARLIIYPNPNQGQFRISYYNPSGVRDLQVITIYDSKGAMVYRKRVTPSGIYTLIDLNMIPATSSFYSVVVSDERGKRLATGKVIVK